MKSSFISSVYGDSDAGCEQKTERNQCCVFPFTYHGEQHHTCTNGGPSNLHWCATTASYDRDGQWDICTGNITSLNSCFSYVIGERGTF